MPVKEIMKRAASLTPPSIALRGIQIQTTKVLGLFLYHTYVQMYFTSKKEFAFVYKQIINYVKQALMYRRSQS